jgi:hypothetical protein
MGAEKSESKPVAFGMDRAGRAAGGAYQESLAGFMGAGGAGLARPYSALDPSYYRKARRQAFEALQPVVAAQQRAIQQDLVRRGFGGSPGLNTIASIRLYREAGKNFGKIAESIGMEQLRDRYSLQQAQWGQLMQMLGYGRPAGTYNVQTGPSPVAAAIGQGIGTVAGLGGLKAFNVI